MDEIAAFYAARLDEEEAQASQPPPAVVVGDIETGIDGRTGVPLRSPLYGWAWDPDQRRRDIEADRRLLAELEYVPGPDADMRGFGHWEGIGFAVTLRAARFGGHPDYREAWKP